MNYPDPQMYTGKIQTAEGETPLRPASRNRTCTAFIGHGGERDPSAATSTCRSSETANKPALQ